MDIHGAFNLASAAALIIWCDIEQEAVVNGNHLVLD
jgi:hypothetical protein